MPYLCRITLALICLIPASLATPQRSPDVRELFTELRDPLKTDNAMQQILKVAEKDSKARSYVVARLSPMIGEPGTGPVWQNAVRLAGLLKANVAIPGLVDALARGAIGGDGFILLSRTATLEDDIVAKALAQIGDPAVPPLAKKYRSEDLGSKKTIVWILISVNTDTSRKALRQILDSETDPAIRSLIQNELSAEGKN